MQVVDLATLTGAIMVALGTAVAGLFANSDALADQLTTAARAAGEKLWRLPLEEECVPPSPGLQTLGHRCGLSFQKVLLPQAGMRNICSLSTKGYQQGQRNSPPGAAIAGHLSFRPAPPLQQGECSPQGRSTRATQPLLSCAACPSPDAVALRWCRYRETIKSPIADLINTAGRPGGAIKAALFLQEVSAGPPCVRLPHMAHGSGNSGRAAASFQQWPELLTKALVLRVLCWISGCGRAQHHMALTSHSWGKKCKFDQRVCVSECSLLGTPSSGLTWTLLASPTTATRRSGLASA